MWSRILASALITMVLGVPVLAQPAKLPTADDVKALQAKFKEERDRIVKAGIAQRFIPAIMDKADELAKKSDAAFASARFLQASEAIRQARWQLPYQPVGVPDHVSRIIGNLRLRHAREIKAVAFSPDGTKVATASSDYTVKIWDLGNGHELLTYEGHRDVVHCLAWTPDGKNIVSAGKEKAIKVWNASTGKDVQSIRGMGEYVSALVLSKDGKYVLTGQHSVTPLINGIFVYETATGKFVRDLQDFQNKIGALAMSHDGKLLAAGDDNGNVRLFQIPTFVDNVNQPAFWTQQDPNGATYHLSFSPDDKTLVRVSRFAVKLYATPQPDVPFQTATPRVNLNTNNATCSTFSKDGKTLYVGTMEGNIQLWDPESGQKVGEFKNAHTSAVNSLAFSADGNRMASCSGDFTIRLWDFDVVLQSRDFEGHDGAVWTAAFSPDGSKIVSASADRTVKVWQRETGQVLFTLNDHQAPVTVAQFSPDGKLIASAGADKIIRIYDAEKGTPLRTYEGHQGTITFLDFSPDSKRIVSGSLDRRVKIWDADKGKELVSINDNPSIVAAVAFHPKGKQIAVGNIDQSIRLYDDAGKLQHSWTAHGGGVNGVSFSPNGQWLASCGVDMSVAVWPLASPGQNAMRLTGHAGPVSSVVFRNDNQHLVSCGADQVIKLWKIEGNDAKEMQTFRGHKDWVTNVAFSKDGFHVISASVDRRMKIWEITSRELPLLAEHTSGVETAAVSPNGEIIATGSIDKTIKLWNRRTGVEIATLTGHTGPVMYLTFTPDSKRLISSEPGKQFIRIWDVSPPREIAYTQLQKNIFNNLRRWSSYLATDPEGKTIYIWCAPDLRAPAASQTSWVMAVDLVTGELKYEFNEGPRKVESLAFCANGKIAASGGADGTVRLLDLVNPKRGAKENVTPIEERPFFDAKAGIADLAITPDAETLIVTSGKGEVKIASIAKKEVLKSFKGHDGKIMACIVSPDGKKFATFSQDNELKVWSIDGTELRRWQLSKQQEMFVLNFAFSNDSRQIVTANANTTVYVLDLP